MAHLRRWFVVAVVLAATGGFAGENQPAPSEALKLEYKLRPGMEIRYTLNGAEKDTDMLIGD